MIKQANLEDLHILVPLFDAYRQFYNKVSDLLSAEEFLRERIINNESIIYIIYDDKDIVAGFIQLYPLFSSTRLKRFWILNDLFVYPLFRGKGFSKQLIDEAKKLCIKTNACAMLLETGVKNVIGNNLYTSAGFELRDDANFYEWTNNN